MVWTAVLLCLLAAGGVLAENDSLRVCLKGGGKAAFSLEEIQKITFDLTGVAEEGLIKLTGSFKTLILMQNRPNPFRNCSVIAYDLPRDGKAKLAVYNLNGQLVRELVSGEMKAGRHQAIWDGRNAKGVKVANGLYLYKLESGGRTISKKSIIIR
jgi:hypothetical protein